MLIRLIVPYFSALGRVVTEAPNALTTQQTAQLILKKNIQQHEELMKQIWVSSVFERCLLICSRPCLQNHKMLRGRSGYWLKAQMIRVKCTTRKALFPSKGKAPNPKRKEKITVMRTVLLLAFASLFFFNLFFLFLKLSERICHQAAVNL